MRRWITVLIVSVCSVYATTVWAIDLSGVWNAKVTESITHCENIGKAAPGDYSIEIVQNGIKLSIDTESIPTPYVGTVNVGKPPRAHVRNTYHQHGGYVTELVDIDFKDEDSGHGGSTWRWSDGYHQCGGNFKFTLEKKTP
jgi:hypothetical protein